MRTTDKKRGRLFVISAPSGSGKTTLSRRLLKDGLSLANSVSATTRPPRKGEVNGRDYYFVPEKKFIEMVSAKKFLEHEENFGHYYGTPKKNIEDRIKKGRSVLLSIDVKGAMKVKRVYPRDSVLIFILPPSIETLRKRLRERMSEGENAISDRIKLAKKEMGYAKRYDYRIVNDRLDSAYGKLKKIILSETE